jgi:hypothetical protein
MKIARFLMGLVPGFNNPDEDLVHRRKCWVEGYKVT